MDREPFGGISRIADLTYKEGDSLGENSVCYSKGGPPIQPKRSNLPYGEILEGEAGLERIGARGEKPGIETNMAISTQPINRQQERNILLQVESVHVATTRTFGAIKQHILLYTKITSEILDENKLFDSGGNQDFQKPSVTTASLGRDVTARIGK